MNDDYGGTMEHPFAPPSQEDLLDEVDRLRNEVDAARAIYEMASESWEAREREAEIRGARWALEIALDPSKWPVSKWTPEEIVADAAARQKAG